MSNYQLPFQKYLVPLSWLCAASGRTRMVLGLVMLIGLSGPLASLSRCWQDNAHGGGPLNISAMPRSDHGADLSRNQPSATSTDQTNVLPPADPTSGCAICRHYEAGSFIVEVAALTFALLLFYRTASVLWRAFPPFLHLIVDSPPYPPPRLFLL